MPLIDLYARFLFFMRCRLSHSVIPSVLFSVIPSVLFSVIPSEAFSPPVIPSVAEESRGNEPSGLFPALLSPMWRREVDCAKYEHKTERGLLPDFSQKLFNKDNINYKTSILYRHSAVASCHFPRLLGKARPYYLIVPFLNQRFREMFRQRFACST